MWVAMKRGLRERVGYKLVNAGYIPGANEVGPLANSPEGKVLDADGVTLRNETQADRDARRLAAIQGGVQSLFSNPDPEERLMAAIIKEMAKDIAQAKGLTPAQYRADILSRILS